MAEPLPLEGLRVVDLTWAWAGPWCTTLLADMGAEVIKVESSVRPDIHRLLPTWAANEPGINRAGLFNNFNRNKLSVTLNLASAEGRALLRRLVSASDVIAENFSPRVMGSLGLAYASLTADKPDLVMVSLSGFGQTGPYRDLPAYGDSMWAFSGSGLLTGFPGGKPEMPGTPFSDPIVGVHGALAVLASLYHRRRTGKGQHIDVTQLECILATIPEVIADFAWNRREPQLQGNRHPMFAPQGCYPCAGDDEWLSLSVTDDAEWDALCGVMGRSDLGQDARFAALESRRLHHDELDTLITGWTRIAPAEQRFRELQQAGIPSAPAFKIPALVADPHLNERGFWHTDHHPEAGERTIQGVTWRMSRTPGRIRRSAPCLGEHNDYVFGDLLGLSAYERRQLEQQGVLC